MVDEVQRLPGLLNTVQSIIDADVQKELLFFLTGSSARKLRRGHANLLPGRVHQYELGALAAGELEFKMDSDQALSTGTLPGIYSDDSPRDRMKTLRSYAGTYLKEEIQAEALTRNVEGFARFLYVVAAHATQFLDLSKLASEAQISRQSATRYFEILEETLIVRRCEPFSKSLRRRLIQHPQFFFFDNGVLNGLQNNFVASDDRKGMLFEHLLFTQMIHSAASRDWEISVSSFRTEHGAEIDFIVQLEGKIWAIEAKSASVISRPDGRGFSSFASFLGKPHRSVMAYLGKERKTHDGIDILPWQVLLEEMGL